MPTRKHPRAPCRPNDPPSLHERLIRDLIGDDQRMGRNGFWTAHRELTDELGLDEYPERPFLPDAYLFDRERERILLFEVEISCPLNDKKLFDYGWFWFWWDCEDSINWVPELFVVDRYGNRNELSLSDLYLRECIGRSKPCSPSDNLSGDGSQANRQEAV